MAMATNRRHFGNVRRLPSKRWQASYWHNGARHLAPHTFPAKADGQAWLSAIETDIKRALGRIRPEPRSPSPIGCSTGW